MDIAKRKINDVFSKSGDLTIPRYQRQFIWGERQFRDLINDMTENNDRKKDFFMGSVIFFKKTKESEDLYIIDGQQRLTSILILLSVIHRLFIELGKPALAQGIQQYLRRTKLDGEPVIRIKNIDYPTLEYIVYNYSIENSSQEMTLIQSMDNHNFQYDKNDKFIECFNYFFYQLKNKIDDVKEPEAKINLLEQYRDSILSFYVAEIIVSDEVDAYEIFEILNARGKPLEPHELLKNFILRHYVCSGGIDIAKKRWDDLYNRLLKKKVNFGTFLKHYVTHKGGKESDSNIYESIKSFYPERNVEDLLKELEKCADIYLIISAKAKLKTINKFNLSNSTVSDLYILNKVSKAQIKPVLLSLFRGYDEDYYQDKELRNSVRNIKNILCKYILGSDMTTNTLEDLIYDYSCKIFGSDKVNSRKDFQDFWNKLLAKETEAKDFIEEFQKISFSKQRKTIENTRRTQSTCKIILEELELFISKDYDNKTYPSLTIEHIKDDIKEGNSHQIGNMIPLSRKENKDCNGKDFQGKLKIYKNSTFKIAQLFAEKYEKSNWDDLEIEKRTKELAEKFELEIWKLPNKVMSN